MWNVNIPQPLCELHVISYQLKRVQTQADFKQRKKLTAQRLILTSTLVRMQAAWSKRM